MERFKIYVEAPIGSLVMKGWHNPDIGIYGIEGRTAFPEDFATPDELTNQISLELSTPPGNIKVEWEM